ncbi:cbb3-type cytochrome c oxidase subunit II [Achromobacter xylosoxidans]
MPLFFQHSTTQPVAGVEPYSPLRLMGRDVYIREGCVGRHCSRFVYWRPKCIAPWPLLLAAESMYDHPFLWGSKRTGPDLARVGERYSDEWHRIHLRNPRLVVPESNMPAASAVAAENGDHRPERRAAHARARTLGVPYTDEEIAAAPQAIEGKT